MQDRRHIGPALHVRPRQALIALRVALPLLLALNAGAAAEAASRTTQQSRQTFVISDFDTIRLEAPVEVVVTTGKGASAIGTGERATLDALSLQMGGRTLIIRMNHAAMGGPDQPSGRARIAITTGELRRAVLLGAGSLAADRIKGDRTEASLRGSGTLAIAHVETDQMTIGLMGSGSMILAGRAGDVTATVSGSARLDAAALSASRLRADAEGSVDARLAARESAVVVATGASRAIVTGTTNCTVRKLGSATVDCGGTPY